MTQVNLELKHWPAHPCASLSWVEQVFSGAVPAQVPLAAFETLSPNLVMEQGQMPARNGSGTLGIGRIECPAFDNGNRY